MGRGSIDAEQKRSWGDRMKRSQRDVVCPKLGDLLKQAALEGVITCPKCSSSLEPDAERCSCGWKNVLVKFGFI